MPAEMTPEMTSVPSHVVLSSSTDGDVDFPYKAISRGAVIAIVLAVLAVPGLLQDFSPLLALTLLGIVAALMALRAIRRYPDEFSGRGLAKAGLIVNFLLLTGGIALHTYTYLTEVPEGYTRVKFHELQQAGSDKATDQPTEKAISVHGQDVFLKGYIHPSSGSGLLKHFILVPDLGTCCFGGQPDSSDMVEVTLRSGQTTTANLRKKKLAGKFMVTPAPQSMTDFENAVFYRMRVEQIK